ncbi:unnamed protein product [Brassica rapa subsp. trilocularis]|uniref:(rape) hypothetical protein n=1 Tax=Brassica napus TaxID=3708 RepID=A0A816SMC7_BRANA|nr:unnamed protein product [Brassica napus]
MTTIQHGIGTSYYGQLRVLSGGQAPGGHTAIYGPFGKVIRRLSPASFHAAVAKTCFELKNQLITASYVDDETSM